MDGVKDTSKRTYSLPTLQRRGDCLFI